ncbi:MAG: ABC transporter permease, partial [Gammaproteobacteria bacterium]|nr:ABC transporter permease [Gammaproteobacteria bacterium]
MRLVRLALRWLLLDWRAGELRLLVAALALAAAAVGTVDFFSDRVQRALTVSAVDLLAADAAVESSEAPAAAWEAEARRRGLQTARTLTFPSVLLEGEVTQLVQVKAVSESYPLRGQLRSAERPEDRQGTAGAPLEPGSAWGEARLFAQLGLEPGAVVGLGESRLTLARVLTAEPDRGGDLFQFAPRLMLRLDDVPATGLVTPASRVSHRLLVAGRAADVEAYRSWLRPKLPKGAQLLDVSGARPELSAALDRGTRFLSLAAATVVVLAGAAALLAARRYVTRQTDTAAVLRCLGVSSRGLWVVFLTRLLGVATVATALGGLLGVVAQSALGLLVGRWFTQDLPAPTIEPLAAAAATTLLVLVASVLPPLSRLPLTPPARVLRGNLGPPPLAEWVTLLAAVGALAAFLLWRMGDFSLGWRAMAGVVGTLVVLGLATRGLIAVLGPLRRRGGSAWRYGLAALARHPTLTLVQGVGFGLGIMALLLLSVVRNDLMGAWRDKLPPQTPNHFLINIQPDERTALADLLAQRGLSSAGVFPMIRGRLVSIAGRVVDPAAYESPRAQRLAAREFNLSFADAMQADNRLVAGRWWQPASAAGELSVESGIAETLGIAIGDE